MRRRSFFSSSRKTWAAMLEAIQHAEHSIFLEMYIMVDDSEGSEFVDLLGKKAREGLRVKLVLDSFGSFSLSDKGIEDLRDSGVEVLFFSRWLHRLHRKLLIVDERIAITGGVNIHFGARQWADLAIRIKNPGAVRTALGLFAKTYFKSGGGDRSMKQFLRRPLFAKTATSFLSYGKHRKLKRVYKEKIFGAVHSIKLVTPYFAPAHWLITALDTAALRGVSVEIFIPRTSDSWFMDRVNHFYVLKMKNSKVRFFLFPGMNHAKVLIIDDTEVLVGSQNLDELSFEHNLELGVLTTDPELAKEASEIVENWKKGSTPFLGTEYDRRWYDYILSPIIRLFRPFL